MKNEVCHFLWLLGAAPHGTEDARDAQGLFSPFKALGPFWNAEGFFQPEDSMIIESQNHVVGRDL